MLFANERVHKIALPSRDPSGSAANISFLVKYLIENVMKDPRKELFVVDDAVSVYGFAITGSWKADIIEMRLTSLIQTTWNIGIDQ